MIFAISSVYLLSCTVESAPVIPASDHQSITVYNIFYGVISTWLCIYAIMKLSRTPPITPLWVVSCHTGAVFFALLGQVPWLHDLTLTPGWLSRLSPPAVVVVVFFSIILLYTGIRQARETCRIHDWTIKLHAYIILLAVYFVIFVLVYIKGQDYHFHVHHAIAAVFLSCFFTNWMSRVDIILHGVLIGIAIEGIAFFGTKEAMLFMMRNGTVENDTILASWICIAVLGLLWTYISARKQVQILSIPLKR